jgi:hypothetical protein
MPIVFVHGVATRAGAKNGNSLWEGVRTYLRDKVAPVLSKEPRAVQILEAYWGDLGVNFAWDGASRPRSSLTASGGGVAQPELRAAAVSVASLPGAFAGLPAAEGSPVPATNILPKKAEAGGDAARRGAPPRVRLKEMELSPDQLSDLVSTVLQAEVADPRRRALIGLAADDVARDPETKKRLDALPGPEEEINLLLSLIDQQIPKVEKRQGGLIGMGAFDWTTGLKERLGESLSRAGSLPGYTLSRALTEVRKPANNLLTLFLGDVFRYIQHRGTPGKPGAIPKLVIERFRQARDGAPKNEPLVVLTHSMGGQIVYDVVTAFLPKEPDGVRLRVDFWCATASQVGLFEEMKLFLASSDEYGVRKQKRLVPFPDEHYLGAWWNVWDPNDFISYTSRMIFQRVDDEPYDSGMSVISAHSGYLERASFYDRFALKLKAAKAR